jgi:predicted dehydrogenase
MTRAILALLISVYCVSSWTSEIRIGMIGLDTPHVTDFTELINNPNAKGHIPGARVIAAYKGGSTDIPISIQSVEGFTKTMREKYGVKIYDTIEEVCNNVDVVMIESIDGRPHLAQARIVIAAKKPLFIDKPMAGTLSDAIEIFRLAEAASVPIFSSSSLRFAKNTQAVRQGSIGKVISAETTSPAHLEKTHPELFWYGIHGCESLFTVMGTGCESVQRQTTSDGRIEVVGVWNGKRTGIFRESKTYSGSARGENGEAAI